MTCGALVRSKEASRRILARRSRAARPLFRTPCDHRPLSDSLRHTVTDRRTHAHPATKEETEERNADTDPSTKRQSERDREKHGRWRENVACSGRRQLRRSGAGLSTPGCLQVPAQSPIFQYNSWIPLNPFNKLCSQMSQRVQGAAETKKSLCLYGELAPRAQRRMDVLEMFRVFFQNVINKRGSRPYHAPGPERPTRTSSPKPLDPVSQRCKSTRGIVSQSCKSTIR